MYCEKEIPVVFFSDIYGDFAIGVNSIDLYRTIERQLTGSIGRLLTFACTVYKYEPDETCVYRCALQLAREIIYL